MTNLVVHAGESFRRRFSLFEEDGSPSDISGCSVEAQIALWGQGPVLASFDAVIDGPAGLIDLELSPAVTDALERGGIWDAWLVSLTQERTLLGDGKAILRRGATRRGATSPIVDPSDVWGVADWGEFPWPGLVESPIWGQYSWGQVPWGGS